MCRELAESSPDLLAAHNRFDFSSSSLRVNLVVSGKLGELFAREDMWIGGCDSGIRINCRSLLAPQAFKA